MQMLNMVIEKDKVFIETLAKKILKATIFGKG